MEVASVNGDRLVNAPDMMLVLKAFGPATGKAYVPDFDVNGDGAIGAADIGFVVRNFGKC